jgi:hypothetical protein
METKEYRFARCNKEAWGGGEWDNEPDKIQFEDYDTKMPCLIVRNHGGALCGYVGVTKEHPLFEVNYSSCSKAGGCGEDYCKHSPESTLEVHGGITFSNGCSEDPNGICHTVEKGEDDKVWWFGFDCGHSCDFHPAFANERIGSLLNENGTYKNVAYVKNQIKGLALQLKRIGDG